MVRAEKLARTNRERTNTMTNTEIAVRAAAALIGLAAAALNGFGAWEAQFAREGGWNYLTLAAPFVVAAAAVIPIIAERLWEEHPAKSVFMWCALIPVAVLAFYAARERVHGLQAATLAERASLASAVTLAKDTLSDAREALTKARADEADALKMKACREDCREKWAANTESARQRVALAIADVTAAEAKTIPDAPEGAPTWLLPLCLDLLNFGGLWVGLAPRRKPGEPSPAPARRKATRRPKAAPPAAPARKPRVVLTGTNDNVLTFPPGA